MNVDDLLKKPIETLFLTFFNTTKQENTKNFKIESTYRETKFLKIPSGSHKDTALALSNKYKINFSVKGTSLISVVENNKDLSLNDFLNLIYRTVIVKLKLSSQRHLDEEIALAMFIPRGSADFIRGYYAVDLKREVSTKLYLDNFFNILLSSENLISRLNFNFRELQPQYINESNKRNTQVRINLKWFYDNVIKNFPDINKYKTKVMASQIDKLGDLKNFYSFEERIVFYRENLLGRKLSKKEINVLREELNFSNSEIIERKIEKIRNPRIISYAREILPDICVACNSKYNIKDRSFKMPRNDRYYFEINHVIPWANDSKAVDVFDNLVKLCPVCHRALSPHRAYESLQKEIIGKMINSREEVKSFINSMMTNSNETNPINYVYSLLK